MKDHSVNTIFVQVGYREMATSIRQSPRRFSLSRKLLGVILALLVVDEVVLFGEGLISMTSDTSQVFLGKDHNITLTVNVTAVEVTDEAWELRMWMSQTPDGSGERIQTQEMLSETQRYQALEAGGLLTFSDLTYQLKLGWTPCYKTRYICAAFGVRGVESDVGCHNGPRCKDGIVVNDVTLRVENASQHIIDAERSPTNVSLSVTVHYDSRVTGNISATTGGTGVKLWRLLVWTSDNPFGQLERHALKAHNVLSSEQARMSLVVGDDLTFHRVIYDLDPRDLTCDKLAYICVRFKLAGSGMDHYVMVSRPHSIARTACHNITCIPVRNVTATEDIHPSTTERLVGAYRPQPITLPLLPTASTHGLTTYPPRTKNVSSFALRGFRGGENPPRNRPPADIGESTEGGNVDRVNFTEGHEVTPQRTPPSDGLVELLHRLGDISGKDDVDGGDVDEVMLIMEQISLHDDITQEGASEIISDISDFIKAPILQSLDTASTFNASHVTDHLSRIVDSIELDETERSFHFVSENMQVSTFEIPPPEGSGESSRGIGDIGQIFRIGARAGGTGHSHTAPSDIDSKSDIQERGVEAGFFIPSDALALPDVKGGSQNVRFNFIVYEINSLFNFADDSLRPGLNGRQQRLNSSRVTSLDVTHEGRRITSLSRPASLAFQVPKADHPQNYTCVWWDFGAHGGFGGWSPEGCTVAIETDDTVICDCDHLTNFAVLMMPNYDSGKLQPPILDTISKIGCAISMLGLGLTLLTYLTFRKLMPATAQLILIQWVFALFCLYAVFLFGIEQVANPTVCQLVAVALHFFLLAYLCWTGVEALHMYIVLVQTMNGLPRTRKFVPSSSAFAWGVPFLIVATTYFTSLMEPTELYELEEYCFLCQGVSFAVALLAPIAAILIFNLTCFALILYRINFTRPKVTMLRSDRQKLDAASTRVKQAMSIAILVGVTWILGFFAIIERGMFFAVLFCVSNTLTGLAVFLVFCAGRQEVRQKWGDTILNCRCCFAERDRDFRRRGLSNASSVARQTSVVNTHSVSLEFMPKSMILELASPTFSDSLESPQTDRSICSNEYPWFHMNPGKGV